MARLGYETYTGQRGPATEAYERGRDDFRADDKRAQEQYPVTYYTGNIGAGVAVPISRAAQAATLPMRMRRGAAAAGLFGGLSGVGSGETGSERAIRGVIGAATGSVLGAGMGAVAPILTDVAGRAGRAILRRVTPEDGGPSSMMRGAQDAPHVRANRTPEIYDPPPYTQRPFADDYPNAPRTDAAGNLMHDMDGRPLHAQFVFGRRTKDGPDIGMQPDDYDRLAIALMGRRPTYKHASEMELGEWGYSKFNHAGRMNEIGLRHGMRPVDKPRVYSHELAHGIDEFVRQIPVEKFMRELRPLYNTLNNPTRTTDGLRAAPGRMVRPEDLSDHYKGAAGLREYAAEAIRMYLTHPNYIKRVAPETAAMVRKWVNEHPELSRIIQFNSLLAAPAAGLARPSEQAEDGL